MQILEIDRPGIAISVRRGFVSIKDADTTQETPIDELDCVILNSYGATLSNQFLIRLCELNIPLLICGANAVPSGILLANTANVFRKSRIDDQISVSRPLMKNLWQSVVRAKIIAQASLLHKLGRPQKDIALLIPKVTSGDAGNCEAIAARRYWQRLFGKGFKRDYDAPGINALLNYGYAILRAAFCRSIAAAGLLPEYGIFHRNLMNPFCLADDLMEPLRPFVDEIVAGKELQEIPVLNPQSKRHLIAVLDRQVEFEDKTLHVRHCIPVIVSKLVESFTLKKCTMRYPALP